VVQLASGKQQQLQTKSVEYSRMFPAAAAAVVDVWTVVDGRLVARTTAFYDGLKPEGDEELENDHERALDAIEEELEEEKGKKPFAKVQVVQEKMVLPKPKRTFAREIPQKNDAKSSKEAENDPDVGRARDPPEIVLTSAGNSSDDLRVSEGEEEEEEEKQEDLRKESATFVDDVEKSTSKDVSSDHDSDTSSKEESKKDPLKEKTLGAHQKVSSSLGNKLDRKFSRTRNVAEKVDEEETSKNPFLSENEEVDNEKDSSTPVDVGQRHRQKRSSQTNRLSRQKTLQEEEEDQEGRNNEGFEYDEKKLYLI
jgi:hypothetical protein